MTLVICGVIPGSPVSQSLDSVGLLGAEYVELFDTFNDGMEWTENEYLRAWYRSQKTEVSAIGASALRRSLLLALHVYSLTLTFHHSCAK